ncbi:MCE family protein [Mycobacterium sp. Aquia_216]|uniref:MCE family protein n=1 Tax=Mycobacterium sp. Aquia_216 TaxID=2991729 RepID=UPI00227BD9E9|nr:MCE family protein [Mycobacterium sp. Aquia_216]WAJ44326.1 MCE family protein [Mycobacterium sp. Aquia_216]
MPTSATRKRERRLHPGWWTAAFVLLAVSLTLLTTGLFNGSFRSYVSVTLVSDRAGLVMDPGAKVKLRGVQVGQVAGIVGGHQPVALKLDIDSDQISHIPANIGAQIRATTAFGAKYVDLIYPEQPSRQHLAAGTVLASRNVTTEVNTVFQNVVDVLHQVDPPKLNAIISALADGVRGQGQRIGEATTDANDVLLALNARSDAMAGDWRSFKRFSDAYNGAANNIVSILDSASATSRTVAQHSTDLDALLLSTAGFASSGVNLLAPPNQQNFIDAVNTLEPTTALLLKYSPTYTCLLVGTKLWYDKIGRRSIGGNGRTAILDAFVLWGADPYRYPDNLPIVAAKGGPGGKPSCGSLPDVSKNFPVRALVTNTGWGTGIDYRPNPGIGHPWFINYFPVTRPVPDVPHIAGNISAPAPGPIPYPGAPAYGAPLYGPGGVPLWPGVPPAPAPQESPPAAAAPPSDTPAPSPAAPDGGADVTRPDSDRTAP